MAGEHIPTMPQSSMGEHIPTMPQSSIGEHIPTMPQSSMGEHIPTMPQSSMGEHIPTMPQSSMGEHIPTMPQGSMGEHIPTVPQATGAGNHAATIPQAGTPGNAVGQGKRLFYSDLDFQADNGEKFRINGAALVSGDTGEAQIYRCTREDGSGDYVAKVLIALRPDASAKKLRTREKVLAFLDQYSGQSQYHILPLIAHGTVQADSGSYFVDIYPYCSEGDLSSRTEPFPLEQLQKEVIPAINEAIHIFHENRLVHRDLKPDNLFYYEGQVVLGDFGISCELNTDDYAVDTEKTGTLGYFAPELMSEAAIMQSDYYSMGQTIWTLYHGEPMYRMTIKSHGGYYSQEARNTVSDLMRKNEFPGLDEIEKKDNFFEVLIRGLLQYDPNERFGYKKVKRWLTGDKKLYLDIKPIDGSGTFDRVLEINGMECMDNNEVAVQLGRDWVKSLALLYNDTLYQMYEYTLVRHEEAAYIQEIRALRDMDQTKPQEAEVLQDVGLSKVILYLSGGRLLSWKGHTFASVVDISDKLKEIDDAKISKEDIYRFIVTGVIEEWLEKISDADEKVYAELRRMREMAKASRMGVMIAYYWMYYMFLEKREEGEYLGNRNITEVADRLLSSPQTLYEVDADGCCVENPRLLGFLCALGYDDSVAAFVSDEIKDYRKNYDMLFDFFENNIRNEECLTKVHRSYMEFGPKAYLAWWQAHLDDYKFYGKRCAELGEKICNIKINPEDGLAQQRAAFSELEQCYGDFRKYFRFDFLMGLAGIQKYLGRNCIYSGKLSCMIAYHFLGQDAPIGYKYALKI